MRALRILNSILGFVAMGLGAVSGMPIVFGAALTTEAPVTMWEKLLEQRLANKTPFARMAFVAFKSWAMQHLRGKELQLIDITDQTVDTNPLDGAIRVYAIYLKKQATATDAWFKVFDNATDDATAGDAKIALPILESGVESFAFFPDGIPLANGLVIGSYTAFIGANNATPTTAGDGPNGFLLVG